MPHSHQLGVCSPDPSSHTSDLLLARENWIFSACYQQRRKSKNELLPPEGHLTQQISTSNQFISKALSKLLQTRFWCKNPSVLSAERRHRPGPPLSNLVSAVTICLQPVQLMFCTPRIRRLRTTLTVLWTCRITVVVHVWRWSYRREVSLCFNICTRQTTRCLQETSQQFPGASNFKTWCRHADHAWFDATQSKSSDLLWETNRANIHSGWLSHNLLFSASQP